MTDTNKPVTETELLERSQAPRVTLEQMWANIKHEAYFNMGKCYESMGVNPKDIPPSLYLLTMCVLTLQNGFTVTGESACADAGNYKEDIGQRVARANAESKIWALMGYALRNELMAIK